MFTKDGIMGKLDIFTALFISLPEGILLTILAIQLLDTKVIKFKTFIVGMLYALTSLTVRSFNIPYGIHTIILIFTLSIYSSYLLSLRFPIALLTYLFTSIITGVVEVVTVPAIEYISGIPLESAVNSISLKILFYIPIQLIIVVIYFVLNRFNVSFLNKDAINIIKQDSKVSRTLIYTIGLLLFQNFIIILLYLSYKTSNFHSAFIYSFINIFPLVILTLILISIVLITVIKKNMYVLYRENEYELQNIMLENVDEVIKALRRERHDYANDFQILYGLSMAQKYDHATEYLEEVCADISYSSNYINIGCPAVSGLFMVKSEIIRTKGIHFASTLDADLSKLNIKTHDLCKVFGNLIQNAIEGTEKCEKKLIQIGLLEDEAGFIIFNIKNTISHEIHLETHDLFKHGTSTKGEGRGAGLDIVKQIVERNKGYIEVRCSEETVEFIVSLPV
jgi:two-component system, LytTR family, sensor histidine kinase AgrC